MAQCFTISAILLSQNSFPPFKLANFFCMALYQFLGSKWAVVFSSMLHLPGILLLLVAANVAIAQSQEPPSKPNYRYRQVRKPPPPTTAMQLHTLKARVQPLGLLNFVDMNLTGGLEYIYAKNKGISFDFGYVFASGRPQQNNSGLSPAVGFIGRLGHRFYISDQDAWFIDADITARTTRYNDGEQWVGRGVVNGVPAYEELMQVYSRFNAVIIECKGGRLAYLSPSGRSTFEYWLGLGARYRNFYAILPEDAMLPDDGFQLFARRYGSSWLPSISIGCRFAFTIKGATPKEKPEK